MSTAQRDTVDAILRSRPFDPAGNPLEQRGRFERVVTAAPVPTDVVTTPGDLGGVPVLTIEIPGVSTEGTVLYFHGGFFAIGSAAASVGLAADLARHAHRQVITVDYRLAPEHPYPAAVDDATAAYRALLDTGVDPGRLAVAGESAGANLAVSVLVAARLAGLAQPSSAVLMSPWVDLAGSGASVTTKAAVDPIITADAIGLRAADYLAGSGIEPADVAVSPVHADLTGLPPLLIQVGSHEVLLDDAVGLAARAARDDVDVTLDVTAGVPHVFQAFAAHLDEGRAALARAGDFLRSHTSSPVPA